MKLGRKLREGLGRDERVALVSFRLPATFCERACLGLITRLTSREKGDCKQSNVLTILD